MDRCHVIICAAGAGRRMGMNKALARRSDGRSFLEDIVSRIDPSLVEQIVVVLGAEAEAVRQVHAHLNLRWLYNSNWQSQGMMESLCLGLRFVGTEARVVHWPVDCIGVNEEALSVLMKERGFCAALSHERLAGHPVYLSPRAVAEILCFPDKYLTLRHFLGLFETRLRLIEAGLSSQSNCNRLSAEA